MDNLAKDCKVAQEIYAHLIHDYAEEVSCCQLLVWWWLFHALVRQTKLLYSPLRKLYIREEEISITRQPSPGNSL